MCTITGKSNKACGAPIQLGLQEGQVPSTVPGFGVFATATGDLPHTCSLECTSPSCRLGDNGARYKTPELEGALAMQLLIMHNEKNHRQPVQTGKASTQNRRVKKVSRPTIKMGNSEDDFILLV